jgi:hypothetical protein
MSNDNNSDFGFQDDYGEVAENVQPEHHTRHVLEITTVIVLILFVSGILAVNMYYPQHAFWKDDSCRYQFEMENTGFENGEYRIKIGKIGDTPVNTTLDAEGTLITSYDNLTISDQVFVYLPEGTESLTAYGDCGRSATLQIS